MTRAKRSPDKWSPWLLPCCILAAFFTYMLVSLAISETRLREQALIKQSMEANKDFLVKGTTPEMKGEFTQETEKIMGRLAIEQGESTPGHGSEVPVAELDGEWASFPRSTFDCVQAFAHRAQKMEPMELFRHEALNAADKYVPPNIRSGLVSRMARFAAALKRVESLQTGAAVSELRSLIDADRARSISISETIKKLEPEAKTNAERLTSALQNKLRVARESIGGKVRPDRKSSVVIPSVMFRGQPMPFVHTTRGDTVFAASLEELPATQEVRRFGDFLTLEMAASVTEWFQENSCLSDVKRVELLTEVSTVLADNWK